MLTASGLLSADPKEYFSYSACAVCLGKPCNDMRFAAFRQGDFLLAHHRNYPTLDPCPFAAGSFDEAEFFLTAIALHRLDMHIQELIAQFTPSEAMNFNQNHYFAGRNDLAGRIEYLRALWDARVFSLMRIPAAFDLDEKMKAWINAWDSVVIQQPEEKKEEAAEAPEETAAAGPSLTNPRWEHADENKAKENPDFAVSGDKIFLKADVTGFADDAPITFEILDSSSSPERKIATITGRNTVGVAKVQWTVDNQGDNDAEFKPVFEAKAGRLSSGRCEISTKKRLGLWFQVDLDNPVTEDDVITLKTVDGSESYPVALKELKEIKKDLIFAPFPKMQDGKKYDLIYDPGKDGEPYVIEHDVDKKYLMGEK